MRSIQLALAALSVLLLPLTSACNGDDIHDLIAAGAGGASPECLPSAVIGDACGGGIVYADFYMGSAIILVAAPADEGVLQWKTSLQGSPGAGDFVDGRNNTGTFNSSHPASFACQNKTTAGYTDWYLAAGDEQTPMYGQRAVVGGFVSDFYWTSSEQTASWAAALNMGSGGGNSIDKTLFQPVRCIRRPF